MFAAVLLCGGLIAVVEVLVAEMAANHRQQQRIQVISQLAEIRARLEGEMRLALQLTRGLIAYVARHPEIGNEEFTRLATDAMVFGNNIRNIALARDNVISHIYPLIGNEKALGLRYEDWPAQRDAVRRVVATGSTVVAGPLDLVQGGSGIVARTPIYLRPDESGTVPDPEFRYWGLVSIVIDAPGLFRNAGLVGVESGLRLLLRGKDGLGDRGGIILGEAEVLGLDPVQQEISLPGGTWQLAAVPAGGWNHASAQILIVRHLGWLLAVLLGVLVGLLLNERQKNLRLALHDQLTGLPNRRLLEDRLAQARLKANRNASRFSVFLVDMDGFKAINDQHGHHVGDEVLTYIARQLNDHTRSSDTVARIGGDEFLVVTPEIADEEEAARKSGQIHQLTNTRVVIEGIRLELRASIGIALYPRDGASIDDLLRSADRNMYSAKHARKSDALNLLG